MSWSEREEDLVQEAVDLIWREHGRVNGTPCYEAALRMLQCARAAEERGRRRGVEEQADLLLECEEALVWCSAADAFSPDGIAVKGWQRIVVPVLERIRAVRKILAPRDSAPACDAVLSSDPFREWRCGKPKDHEGPHSGDRK